VKFNRLGNCPADTVIFRAGRGADWASSVGEGGRLRYRGLRL